VRIGSCAVLPSFLSLPPLHAQIMVLVLLGALDSPTDRLNWFQSFRLVPSAHQIYSGPIFLERRFAKCFICLTTPYLAQTLVSNDTVISEWWSYAWRYWGKLRRTSVKTACILAQVWTQDVSNTIQECYPPDRGVQSRLALVKWAQKRK
jgi:hypothetical protein